MLQHRMIGLIPHQLHSEIGFYGGADVRRAAFINGPASIRILVTQDFGYRQFHAAAVARAQQSVDRDVIGFTRGISFQLAAPVTVGVLRGKQKLARGGHAPANPSENVVDLCKKHLRGGIATAYSPATGSASSRQ